MATFHASVKTGDKGTAKIHAQYIARKDNNAEKVDLVATGHGNLPDWAQCNLRTSGPPRESTNAIMALHTQSLKLHSPTNSVNKEFPASQNV